jgi:hypothetical protein
MDNQFSENVKQWIILDNQMKLYNDKLKELRKAKNDIENTILDHVNKHSLTNSIVKITDGKLKFGEYKQTSPISLKYVEQCIVKCLGEEKVKQIMEFIKKNREVKSSLEIKRIYDKNVNDNI